MAGGQTPEHLHALFNPLGLMDKWTSKKEARGAMEDLAYCAMGQRSHSLWWNYIYLHEQLVQTFELDKNERLPGFPDMDTAVKVGAPSVYNWYYCHKGIAPTTWSDVDFCDLSVSVQSGFVTRDAACEYLNQMTVHFGTPAAQGRAAPLWLLADAWRPTASWGLVLEMVTRAQRSSQVISAGISQLDRQLVDPVALWQWSCMAEQDIDWLPQEQAMQALDQLRFSGNGDTPQIYRRKCENHFLEHFPQCKPLADIAFSLGGPLWVAPLESLDGPSVGDLFTLNDEALHAK